MKLRVALVIFLLPYATIALYNESSSRKVKLEDIEDEHIQSERQSKAAQPPQSLPPPLHKQPAKGQPTKSYPPIMEDNLIADYHKQSPTTTTHRYSTRAQQQHHVQPLTDQPTAPEADYQQSPAYQTETIVYLPPSAHGQPLHQRNDLQHQFDVVQHQQQPSPVFYYSHDMQQQQQQQSQQQPSGNGYQVQFVPIGQHGGSDEQSTYAGSQATGAQEDTANQVAVVSYSHDSTFGGAQSEAQQQEPVQYVIGNEAREPNNIQQVYGLPENVFQLQKDIEYAKPTNTYGPPPRSEYSQKSSLPYSNQKDIAYVQQVETEIAQKPAIIYGPPDTVGQSPQIQYGVPDAPFRRPTIQSNQNAYAPRRPDSSARSNEKPFAVSFPYPPSFVSITTKRPFFEQSTPAPEQSYNEISPWQANVMPLHLIPPQKTQYRSFGSTQPIQVPPHTSSADVSQHIESQSAPFIDFFHSRSAKSLLDSYIPSWLVARMQDQHARQLQQQQQQQQEQQTYAISSPAAEPGYNTIAYSTQFENIYGKNFKRSIQRGKAHQKKKSTLAEPKPTVA